MAHIALLHPQCVRVGGAIQMALQSAQALQKQGHTVTLYTFEKSDACFPDLQKGLDIRVWQTGKNISFFPMRKLIVLLTLAWELRHVDIIIANNPPMQIVAAIAKIFIGRIKTIWWHHHIPWYLSPEATKNKEQIKNKKEGSSFFLLDMPFRHFSSLFSFLSLKAWLERALIIPNIDVMVATSYFIADKIEQYCEREATVIHPIIQMNNEEGIMKNGGDNSVTLFTHGRLEAGKGLDMLVRVFKKMKNEEGRMNNGGINLIIFGTGSLEAELREKGVDVRPFDREKTFTELKSGEYGHVLGVYCSEIDGFGMAPLECQMTGISTVILDRAGARETIVANMSDEPVGYLVDSEEQLFSTISYYIKEKIFPKDMSNVNFYHQRDHFTPERLSRDLLSLINRTGV